MCVLSAGFFFFSPPLIMISLVAGAFFSYTGRNERGMEARREHEKEAGTIQKSTEPQVRAHVLLLGRTACPGLEEQSKNSCCYILIMYWYTHSVYLLAWVCRWRKTEDIRRCWFCICLWIRTDLVTISLWTSQHIYLTPTFSRQRNITVGCCCLQTVFNYGHRGV